MNFVLASLFVMTAQLPTDTLWVTIESAEVPLRAIEDLRIGSVDGPEETTFGYIASVVESEDGVVLIADQMPGAIRVFDTSGTYLRDIGRNGEGPGEYTFPGGLALTPEGRVAVWDFNQHRLSYFALDGTFERSFPVEMRVMVGGPGAGLIVDPESRLLLRTAGPMDMTGNGPREAAFSYLRVSPDGEFIDSLTPPRRNVGGSLGPFRHETTSALSPLGYFVTGRNDRYRLTRPLSDGRTVVFERTVEQIPLAGSEREQWTAYHEEWKSRMNASPDALPERKPVWRSLAVDDDGRIWVARYQAAEHRPDVVTRAAESFGWPNVNWIEPVAFDVLDPRGALIGTVTLPPSAEFMSARGNHLWVSIQGEFDEHYAVRYVLQPGQRRD